MHSTSSKGLDRALPDEREKRRKLLTFLLGREEYALDILSVREIIGLLEITRVPRLPPFVRGVINLRGKIVPVIDLRLKFGLEGVQDTKETCIIVVDLAELLMGVVVDKVSEVVDLAESEIEETPTFGVRVDTQFIVGIGKTKGRVIILLDIAKVITSQEFRLLAEGSPALPPVEEPGGGA